MKKSIALAAASLMIILSSGCTDTNKPAENDNKTQVQSQTEETTAEAIEETSEETTEETSKETSEETSEDESKDDEKEISNVKYELGKYKDKGISVKYPVISEETIKDKKIRNRANSIIEEDAVVFIDKYELKSDDNTDTDIAPVSVMEFDDILSVVYEGDCYTGDSTEPIRIRFTSNIDMNRGTRCSLTDFYDTEKISEILADTDDFEILCDDKKLAKEMKRYIQSYSANRLDDFIFSSDFYTENKKTVYPSVFSSYEKEGYLDITFIFDDPELELGNYGIFRIKTDDINDTKNKK